jgi:hypothetical protein
MTGPLSINAKRLINEPNFLETKLKPQLKFNLKDNYDGSPI